MASHLYNQQVHFQKYDPFVGSFGMIAIFFCVALTNHLATLHSHPLVPQSTTLIVKSR
jgi:hypothetical protein